MCCCAAFYFLSSLSPPLHSQMVAPWYTWYDGQRRDLLFLPECCRRCPPLHSQMVAPWYTWYDGQPERCDLLFLRRDVVVVVPPPPPRGERGSHGDMVTLSEMLSSLSPLPNAHAMAVVRRLHVSRRYMCTSEWYVSVSIHVHGHVHMNISVSICNCQ